VEPRHPQTVAALKAAEIQKKAETVRFRTSVSLSAETKLRSRNDKGFLVGVQ